MEVWKALVLALVQGITEFLPVSSSGHLALFKILFGLEEAGILYDVLLHVGTLVAVFVVYHKDIWKLIKEAVFIIGDIFYNFGRWIGNVFSHNRGGYHQIINNVYRRFVILILIATIPTGIIGVLDADLVEKAGMTTIIPGMFLLVTGVLLLLADFVTPGVKAAKDVGYPSALLVGLAQGVATFPGLSRSGTTIAACLLLGMDKKFAVKYSFILSIPAILGSLVFKLGDLKDMVAVGGTDIAVYVGGMVIAAAVGFLSIKLLQYIASNKKFVGFAIYCFVIGAASVVVYFVTR